MKLRILVADDEKNIREGLREALALDGYEVVTAADGQEALEEVTRGEVDLLITDLKMPRLSGEELLKSVTAQLPTMPVIILTGHGTIESAVQAALTRSPGAGVVERLMDGLLEAEKRNALVKPEYAALEKAFILYVGYSPYLPKDFLFTAMERALAARFLRDRPISLGRLAWLGLRWMILGRSAVRAELNALIDSLQDSPRPTATAPGATSPSAPSQKSGAASVPSSSRP